MQALLQMVVELSDYPGQYPVDESVSFAPLSFWQTFFDDISSADMEVNLYIYM